MSTSSHRDLILDQLTRQATPFSTAKTIASEEALAADVRCGIGSWGSWGAVSENSRFRQGAGGAPRSDRRRRGLVLPML